MKLFMFDSSMGSAVHYVAADTKETAAQLLTKQAPDVNYNDRNSSCVADDFDWLHEEVIARWAWGPPSSSSQGRMIHAPDRKGGVCVAAVDNHYGYGARFRCEGDYDFEAVPVCETCRIVLRCVGYTFESPAVPG